MHRNAPVVELALLNMRIGNHVRVTKQVTERGLQAIVPAMQRASCVSIRFSSCVHLTDVGLQNVGLALQQATIVSLNFKFCNQINDAGLQAIGSALQHAISVSFNFSFAVTSLTQGCKISGLHCSRQQM
jgi:hypothetical protein